jgi:hypothetical protein
MHILILQTDVKISWYEVGENEDAISVYSLEHSKIPLSSAEL